MASADIQPVLISSALESGVIPVQPPHAIKPTRSVFNYLDQTDSNELNQLVCY
jgi:hypothetical protein